jgi:calcineurin-like phosphoesterase family protein
MAKMRGFESSEEHDQVLIDSWNKVINKKDKVFVHGDITMENSKFYYKLASLKGRKHVILGNHDRAKDVAELLKYVEAVSGPVKYKGYFLSHIPIHPSELEYRVRGNIHAHVHENHIAHEGYFNVDIHERNMQPVRFEAIDNLFQMIKQNKINK